MEASQSTTGDDREQRRRCSAVYKWRPAWDMEMSAPTPVLGRSGAARCGREKQVRGGQRRLAHSGETELMKWCQRATSGATNEAVAAAAARERTADESAEGSVLMRCVQRGRAGLLPPHTAFTLRSHWRESAATWSWAEDRPEPTWTGTAFWPLVIGKLFPRFSKEENCWPIARQG